MSKIIIGGILAIIGVIIFSMTIPTWFFIGCQMGYTYACPTVNGVLIFSMVLVGFGIYAFIKGVSE